MRTFEIGQAVRIEDMRCKCGVDMIPVSSDSCTVTYRCPAFCGANGLPPRAELNASKPTYRMTRKTQEHFESEVVQAWMRGRAAEGALAFAWHSAENVTIAYRDLPGKPSEFCRPDGKLWRWGFDETTTSWAATMREQGYLYADENGVPLMPKAKASTWADVTEVPFPPKQSPQTSGGELKLQGDKRRVVSLIRASELTAEESPTVGGDLIRWGAVEGDTLVIGETSGDLRIRSNAPLAAPGTVKLNTDDSQFCTELPVRCAFCGDAFSGEKSIAHPWDCRDAGYES